MDVNEDAPDQNHYQVFNKCQGEGISDKHKLMQQKEDNIKTKM